MNGSDDEVFEDTIESLVAEETIENQESEAGESTTAIMSPKPKSATKSMTTYKTLCTSRMKTVNDAVKEHQGKTLALKQIEHLESLRDKLVEQEDRMTQSYEQFALEEHEEIDAATTIYQETMTLVTAATGDIQAMIGQAYDELQANQSQMYPLKRQLRKNLLLKLQSRRRQPKNLQRLKHLPKRSKKKLIKRMKLQINPQEKLKVVQICLNLLRKRKTTKMYSAM